MALGLSILSRPKVPKMFSKVKKNTCCAPKKFFYQLDVKIARPKFSGLLLKNPVFEKREYELENYSSNNNPFTVFSLPKTVSRSEINDLDYRGDQKDFHFVDHNNLNIAKTDFWSFN